MNQMLARATAGADQLGGMRATWPSAQQIAAGEKLKDHLILLHVRKELSAKDLCIIAHHHTQSGGHGLAESALHPTQV